jgi:hypothetical protein
MKVSGVLAILAQALMAQPSAGIAIKAGSDANPPIDEEYTKNFANPAKRRSLYRRGQAGSKRNWL